MVGAASTPAFTCLREDQAFPSFSECPHEHFIDGRYYHKRDDGCYVARRHWCFFAEVTGKLVFNRLCLWVKDKNGQQVSGNFYLDSSPGPRIFEPGMSNFPVHRNVPEAIVKEGNTIVILYPKQHDFMDGSIGFRIENADYVQFLPCSLEQLYAISDQIMSGGSKPEGVQGCAKCNTTTDNLLLCAGCRIVRYCSKACQTQDWTESGHRKDCKLARRVAELMKQDWERFRGYYKFPLSKK